MCRAWSVTFFTSGHSIVLKFCSFIPCGCKNLPITLVGYLIFVKQMPDHLFCYVLVIKNELFIWAPMFGLGLNFHTKILRSVIFNAGSSQLCP